MLITACRVVSDLDVIRSVSSPSNVSPDTRDLLLRRRDSRPRLITRLRDDDADGIDVVFLLLAGVNTLETDKYHKYYTSPV